MKFNLAAPALIVSTVGKYGGASAKTIRGKGPQRNLLPLVMISNNPMDPLGQCEGDCDNDSECAPHLNCFKREPRTTGDVPFCSGGETDDPGKDYCTVRTCPAGGCELEAKVFSDEYSETETSWTLTNECNSTVIWKSSDEGVLDEFILYEFSTLTPMAKYRFTINDSQGDGFWCEDGDGWYSISFAGQFEGLFDHTPFNSSSKTVGTCDLWLLKVGDNGVREDNGESMVVDKLGLCEGDCDEDNECQDGLSCFKRSGTAYVPGCWNVGGDPGEDYCIPDALTP